MDLQTQARVSAELQKLSEELEGFCGAVVVATRYGLVIQNLRAEVIELGQAVERVVGGTT